MASPPFKVKAVYEYTSPHEDDLHFPNGQIITVTGEEDDDWYAGEYVDASGEKQEGIFPKNFVEKYEPTAPPRPARISRPKKEEPIPEPIVAPEPVHEPEQEPEPEPEPEVEPEPEPKEVHEAATAREPSPPSPKPQEAVSPPVKPPESSPPLATKPKPTPPPVSDKPSGGSFRDRIAAFNKAAPPPAPFKPVGLGGIGSSSAGSSYLVRKPFVAPPPSKNAYFPVSREPPPQKIYRREEDPEIAAQEAENQEQAEKSGLVATSNGDNGEEQPKPTSLKERIALLQQQQREQAARHAEAAQKKEKPKKPAKKHFEPVTHTEGTEESDGGVLERTGTEETTGKASMDSTREEGQSHQRKTSKPAPPTPSTQPRKSFGDGNEVDMPDAGETTEEPEEISPSQSNEEKSRSKAPPAPARAPFAPAREPEVGEEEGATEEEAPQAEEDEEEEEEEEDEDDVDPEVRRKEELRARMAKMSGGMGMHGMFGPPSGISMSGILPPKKKKVTASPHENRSSEYGAEDVASPNSRAPPVPVMVPLPGLSRIKSHEKEEPEDNAPISATQPADEVPDVEDVVPQERAAPPVPVRDNPPPIPGGRPAPPPIPTASRPTVPIAMSPNAGNESDDEIPAQPPTQSQISSPTEQPRPPQRPEGPASPRSPPKRLSYFGSDASPVSPTASSVSNKRASRVPPPIPGAAPGILPQNRAPPPPPPTASLSRSSTGDQRPQPPPVPAPVASEGSDEEVTPYEGDYDTDMVNAAPPKDPLNSHVRESSLDDGSNTVQSPVTSPLSGPPPLPRTAPRAGPPPLPPQPPPNARRSVDVPKGAPPPPPERKPAPWEPDDDDEYDPYRYSVPKQGIPSIPTSAAPTPRIEKPEEDIYSASPPRHPPHSKDRAPPPPPREDGFPSHGSRAPPRRSSDVPRQATASRKSTELGRMSMDSGYIANDVDLGPKSFWWAQPEGIPPVFQGRKDILFEFLESPSESGSSLIAKEVFILFQDYSQTVVTAEFDPQNPADIQLSQRHEPPPSRLRQDHLEDAHESFGRRIFEAVQSKKETVVGNGTPQGLITELLRPFSRALRPIGTRAYGALVYANLANASTVQNDQIRPGDIITLRNTKFQGKHGPMHAKYSVEIGKPDHVAVVAEWDGTKKKIRAWEQGRESKKVRLESYKLDDLRSGEVKVWRIMPRSWVGWRGKN